MARVRTVEGAHPDGLSEVQSAVQASDHPRGRGWREARQSDLSRALALAPHGVCDSAGTPLSDSIVRRWVEQYRERGADAFRTGDPKAEELAAAKKRIAELEAALGRATLEVDFLRRCVRRANLPLPESARW